MKYPRAKHRLGAIGLTLLLHIGLLGGLWLLRLEGQTSPPKATELVLIDIGNVEQAEGLEEPEGTFAEEAQEEEAVNSPQPELAKPSSVPVVKPIKNQPQPAKPTPNKSVKEELQTQRHEESLRLAEQKQEAERLVRAEAEARAKAEADRLQAEREAQRKAVGSSVANAFGAGRTSSAGRGNATGSGNQGNPQGLAGGSFDLAGRTIVSNGGQLIPPTAQRAIRGRVNVRIVVNSAGLITDARIAPKGTTIADESIRSAALRAARATRFNAQEGAEEQWGIITYNFDIQ